MQAFHQALAAGCDGIEFDVRVTSDGVAVVVHDAEYHGLRVEQTPASRLGVPTLAHVLAQFSPGAFLDIELKTPAAVESTMALLSQYGFGRGLLVSSFLPNILKELHARDAALPLGLIFDQPDKMDLWRELPLAYVIPHHSLVTEALISNVHARGLKLLTWTVNRTHEIVRLAELGVEGIISDYPRALVAAFTP